MIPVTAVICEVAYGSSERLIVRYLDGRSEEVVLAEIRQVIARAGEHHESILAWKNETLLRECMDYLMLALAAAEAVQSDRRLLKSRILGEKQSLEESKLALRLIVRHATSVTRSLNEKILKVEEVPTKNLLLREFNDRFPDWTASLKKASRCFEDWLGSAITAEMERLSAEHRAEFTEPLNRVGRQLSRSLQDFRNRISERAIEAIGTPLRTTEMEIQVEPTRSPDIRVGKIFDRNWDGPSFLIPMPLIRDC